MKPTDAELDILQVLWASGPATVRHVNDALNQHRDVGYTTTLKIMQIMQDKGLLTRTEANRSHVYTATVSEEATQQTFTDRLVETVFRGSASKLVMQALGQHKATREELDQIKDLLNRLGS